MTERSGSPAPRVLTVAALAAELAALPQDAIVGAYSGCHDCGGEALTITQGRDGNGVKHVWLTGDVPRPPDA